MPYTAKGAEDCPEGLVNHVHLLIFILDGLPVDLYGYVQSLPAPCWLWPWLGPSDVERVSPILWLT